MIAPLFCPQSLDNLSKTRKTIYYTDLNKTASGWQYTSEMITGSRQPTFKINIDDIRSYTYLNILMSNVYSPIDNKRYTYENLIRIENLLLGFKAIILTPDINNNGFVLPLVAELSDNGYQIVIDSFLETPPANQECYIQQIYVCD